jgi:hypothetical protein
VEYGIDVLHGELRCRSCAIEGSGRTSAAFDGKAVAHTAGRAGSSTVFRFDEPVVAAAGTRLRLSLAVL